MVSILQIRCFLLSYLDFFCSIQREESNLFLKTGRFFLSCSNFSFHFTITRTCVNVVRVCRINLMDEFVERELLNKLVRQIHRIKLLNKSSRPNTLNEFVRWTQMNTTRIFHLSHLTYIQTFDCCDTVRTKIIEDTSINVCAVLQLFYREMERSLATHVHSKTVVLKRNCSRVISETFEITLARVTTECAKAVQNAKSIVWTFMKLN